MTIRLNVDDSLSLDYKSFWSLELNNPVFSSHDAGILVKIKTQKNVHFLEPEYKNDIKKDFLILSSFYRFIKDEKIEKVKIVKKNKIFSAKKIFLKKQNKEKEKEDVFNFSDFENIRKVSVFYKNQVLNNRFIVKGSDKEDEKYFIADNDTLFFIDNKNVKIKNRRNCSGCKFTAALDIIVVLCLMFKGL